MERELILVVDFGGQYNQLIARRVRECGVYCEIVPYSYTAKEIKAKNPKGIIFTGGPNSVYGQGAPRLDNEIFELDIPILGICYGDQLIAFTQGGEVKSAEIREYGKTEIKINTSSKLFKGINSEEICLYESYRFH